MYVEGLLTKDKYCDFPLPRLAAAQRRILNEKLVLQDVFRQRYKANMEVLDRFEKRPDGGVRIEVCNDDGEWTPAVCAGPPTAGRRRVKIPVRFADSKEQDVSIGMIICPDAKGSDLTTSRGKPYADLLAKYREAQRASAVASGKDYSKTSGILTIHAGGQTFLCGKKRGAEEEDSDDEMYRAKAAKREAERERDAKCIERKQ